VAWIPLTVGYLFSVPPPWHQSKATEVLVTGFGSEGNEGPPSAVFFVPEKRGLTSQTCSRGHGTITRFLPARIFRKGW